MTHPAIDTLPAALPGLDWITDPSRIARLSQDFNWYSPVLKRQLAGKSAELGVRPRSEDEFVQVVGAAARAGLPVTLRGSGTGNYGQCVPLRGGLVVDLSAYAGLLWQRGGVARARAGSRLADLDRALAPDGLELRWLPSTFRSATLGGLYGGGFGGAGSVTWGPVAATGNVLGLKLLTVEPEPRLLELRAPEALQLHHTYGTNGIVLELEVALAPARPWAEAVACFETLEAAVRCASAVAKAPGIAKKEIAVISAAVAPYLPHLADALPVGQAAILALVDEASERGWGELLARFGGRITQRRGAAEVQRTQKTLLESTWNHTTLHALKIDRTLTYLQTAFDPARHIEQVLQMDTLLGSEVLTHLEFLRTKDGELTCSGLPLVRFSTEARLAELIALHRAHGVGVNNPHVYVVEDGKQAQPNPALLATKLAYDPQGLLNPGKLRAWEQHRAAAATAERDGPASEGRSQPAPAC